MTTTPHRVLILGAGLVSRPIVRHLLAHDDTQVTVASLILDDAQRLVGGHPRGRAVALDVTRTADVEALVAGADLVVSLVPYAHHPAVARLAIRHRVHVVTTSYVSPEMRALDADARTAGITLLNEIGLDPGIDHMSAVRLLRRVRARGARITGFVSCCGSIPAPEAAATNPWGYKFAWSPRGVLLAGRNAARWIESGTVREVPGTELFTERWPYPVEGLGMLEMYPNRDSLGYVEAYDLAGVETMLRGTLRWPGWCETLRAVGQAGLLDIEERDWPSGTTWAGMVGSLLSPGTGASRERLARQVGLPSAHPVLERLAWAGLFDEEPLASERAAPLDLLVERLEPRMRYSPAERDLVVLRHEVAAVLPDGRGERTVSLLVAHGEPDGDSATARTVSLPAALAARRILDGSLRLPGVHVPTSEQIGEPVLDALAALGLGFDEWTVPADAHAPLLPGAC